MVVSEDSCPIFAYEGFVVLLAHFATCFYLTISPSFINKIALYFEHQIETDTQENEVPKQLEKYVRRKNKRVD